MPRIEILVGDNLDILRRFESASFELIYIDPPFNTGRTQSRTRLRTIREASGDRTGFQGRRYATVRIGEASFADSFDDYLSFLEPRLREARRLLTADGSFFLHVDYREVHYCKVLLDQIFGRPSFINEIIWSYDYGARSRRRWSPKHDNILWYAKDPASYTYRYDDVDRIPYMAPGLVSPEKAKRGKTPTDSWWNTIVSPTGKEKTGYPTQKPFGDPEQDRSRALESRRPRAGLLRRQRDDWGGSGASGPQRSARGPQRGSRAGDGEAPVLRGADGGWLGRAGCGGSGRHARDAGAESGRAVRKCEGGPAALRRAGAAMRGGSFQGERRYTVLAAGVRQGASCDAANRGLLRRRRAPSAPRSWQAARSGAPDFGSIDGADRSQDLDASAPQAGRDSVRTKVWR